MTSPPEPRNRRALLIGIDRYPLLSEAEHLDGAVNDAKAMAQLLTERFGFPEKAVRLLLDQAATRDAILGAMDRLVEETAKDDVVVFHFSGHGSQVKDLEGDEEDGWDETIVPVDSGREPHPNRQITDDEIYSWLLRLTEKTPYVTLIFDCCHSATITRDDFGGKVRGIERDPAAVREPSPWAGRAQTERVRKGESGWLPWDRRWTLFAGCANHEESHEMRAPGAKGVRHGALTHFLVEELWKAKPGETYRDIFERVEPQVMSVFRSQQPQLEGVWDREVFGLRHFEPLRFVPVLGRHRDGRVLLGAGASSGITIGSRWEIHPPKAQDVVPGTELGLVEITGVCAFTSEGRIVREARPDFVGRECRAVERAHSHGDLGWAVDLVIPHAWKEHIGILEDGIRESPLLRPASGEEAHTRAYLLGPRRAAGPGDPAPMLETLEEPCWVAVGKDGRLVLPVRRATAPESAFDLLENLEKLARFHHALAFDNPTSPLRGKVDLVVKRLTDGGPVPARQDDGQTAFYEGELLALEAINRTGQKLHLYAIDFGLSGKVSLLYPPYGTREATSRETLSINTRLGQEWQLTVPDAFPFEAPGTAASGVEFVKLFATTEPVDFKLLFQESFRRDGDFLPGIDDHPLGRLLSEAVWGITYRGPLPGGAARTAADWTTATRSFVLRRRTRAW
ncbi:MAG TPA: caspase family protein [Thermoanaerobaculia bacterium]|nr:caspase family protein [Thermoanaerobaculia bacterium]